MEINNKIKAFGTGIAIYIKTSYTSKSINQIADQTTIPFGMQGLGGFGPDNR
jgi:hypothetical protein